MIETTGKSCIITEGPKQDCRQKIIDFTLNYYIKNEPLHIFTMPSKHHRCYDMFKIEFPLSQIDSVERDKQIANDLRKKGIYAHTCTTTEFFNNIRDFDKPYEILFLDYYNHYTQAIANEIDLIIKNNNITPEDKPFILAVTLSKSIRQGHEDNMNDLKKKSITRNNEEFQYNVNTLSAALSEIFKSLIIYDTYVTEYKATAKSVPMFFLCFALQKR
jgi:hypothetical protein